MIRPEQFLPHQAGEPVDQHHQASHALAKEAHAPHPGSKGHSGQPAPHGALGQTENKLEDIIKHDPNHERMGEVYRELDGLRLKDQPHFGKDLAAINNRLHRDHLLPNLTIIQDRYTGNDRKEHAGYSLISRDQNQPGHRVGSEVSTSHPQIADTPASHTYYEAMHHGRQTGFTPSRDSAEAGSAAGGGFDSHLSGQVVPEGEHKELIDKALQMAGVPVSAATEAAMNKIITRESQWNPNIVNTWDINARRGDPSKGLMQVIHATFEKHRDRSLPDSQTDPLANMVAALHYMGAQYGHGNNTAGLMRVAARHGGY
jgi:hypothetical protein